MSSLSMVSVGIRPRCEQRPATRQPVQASGRRGSTSAPRRRRRTAGPPRAPSQHGLDRTARRATAATSCTRRIAAPGVGRPAAAASVPARRSAGGAARDRAEEVLARDREQQRAPERVQRDRGAQHGDGLRGRLGEVGPGVDDDLLVAPRRARERERRSARAGTPRRRPRRRRSRGNASCLGSARVCMTTSAAPVRAAQLGQRRIAQPADVVEHRGAGVERGARDRRLPGVDGDAHALRREPLDERHDARGLVLGARTSPCR